MTFFKFKKNRFCVGDRFYLNDNKILCEYDYEERLVAVSMPSNTSTQQQQQQHIQRRVSDIHQVRPSSCLYGLINIF